MVKLILFYEKDKLIQDLKKERDLLKQRQKDTLEYIESICQYDFHLMGYLNGIERKNTSTLVLLLTGQSPRDIKRG